MADYGIKISKSGVDVKTAGDDDLIFTTKYSMLKIAKVGTFSYLFTSEPGVGCVTLGTVAHGFDYVPSFDCFFGIDPTPTVWRRIPVRTIIGADTSVHSAYCNDINIVFRFCRNAQTVPFWNGLTVNYKYYIFADPGS